MIYLLVRELWSTAQNFRELIHPTHLVFLDQFKFNSVTQHVFQTREISIDRSVASSFLLTPTDEPCDMVGVQCLDFDFPQFNLESFDTVPLPLPCAIADFAILFEIPVGKLLQRESSGIRTPSKPILQLPPGSITFGDTDFCIYLFCKPPALEIAPETTAIGPVLINADLRFSILVLLDLDAQF